jgi:hypothetical protein
MWVNAPPRNRSVLSQTDVHSVVHVPCHVILPNKIIISFWVDEFSVGKKIIFLRVADRLA